MYGHDALLAALRKMTTKSYRTTNSIEYQAVLFAPGIVHRSSAEELLPLRSTTSDNRDGITLHLGLSSAFAVNGLPLVRVYIDTFEKLPQAPFGMA
jgi:hypothetical protein